MAPRRALKDVLAPIPGRYGVVRGSPPFPAPAGGRLVVRRADDRPSRRARPPRRKDTSFTAIRRSCTGPPKVKIEVGHSGPMAPGLLPLAAGIRSRSSTSRSGRRAVRAQGLAYGWLARPAPGQQSRPLATIAAAARAGRATCSTRARRRRRGCWRAGSEGTLVIDTRVRDALRALRRGREIRVSRGRAVGRVAFPRPTAVGGCGVRSGGPSVRRDRRHRPRRASADACARAAARGARTGRARRGCSPHWRGR